jgi:hypothetical protein
MFVVSKAELDSSTAALVSSFGSDVRKKLSLVWVLSTKIGYLYFTLMMLVQVIGGAVAVFVGAFVFNFGSLAVQSTTYADATIVRDSDITLAGNAFLNCSSISLTVGLFSGSFGSSSVYGGAFAILQSAKVFQFTSGLMSPPPALILSGTSLTVKVLNSTFSDCSALSNSTSTRPGLANGGGGAMYVNSVALSSIIVRDSTFESNSVFVACGATGAASNSSGGALSVEARRASQSVVEVESCSFFNCTARGASIANLAVRGGAVAVFGTSSISITGSNFTNCSIAGALSASMRGIYVSGGAGISAVLSDNVFIDRCHFDASGGQDASETSIGVLVLASNADRSAVNISQTSTTSSSVAINVRCVTTDSFASDSCSQSGPSLVLLKSNISQQIMVLKEDFNVTGSALISLQSGISPLFLDSRLNCVSSLDFAASKKSSEITASVDFSCSPCAPYSISLSAREVLLEQLARSTGDSCRILETGNRCPFGVEKCSTFVTVVRGFWANFSSRTPSNLTSVIRCPRGYCDCSGSESACLLTPLLSIDRRPDPLCSGARIGFLCGGCPPNFTQSLNDKNCVSNEVCSKNLGWLWALSILAYAAYSFYIVMSSRTFGVGAFSCLVFYFQVSSFAVNTDKSDGSVAILEFFQVQPLLSQYEGACFAPSMSAYDATAAKLTGPSLVVAFTAGWTGIIQVLQPRLQQRNIDITVSFGGTLAAAGLFMFSSVSKVIFTLVECSSYDGEGVIFIDGTVPCNDTRWKALIVVAALLCLCPLAFAYALHHNKLPQSTRDVVCGKLTEAAFFWGAITLAFRLLMSATQFLRVESPNLMACVRLMLSVGMSLLLVFLRPYVRMRTFWVDVSCYICLIAQFSVQTIQSTREHLRVLHQPEQEGFYTSLLNLSTVIRSASILIVIFLFISSIVIAFLLTFVQVYSHCCFGHHVAAAKKSF